MTIGEFLSARLDEDEAAAKATSVVSVESRYKSGANLLPAVARLLFHRRFDPEHVLADVAAKRRVMARHRPATGNEPGWYSYVGSCIGCGTEGEFADPRTRHIDDCPELRDLAAPNAGHPDYNPSWRVPTTEENDHG